MNKYFNHTGSLCVYNIFEKNKIIDVSKSAIIASVGVVLSVLFVWVLIIPVMVQQRMLSGIVMLIGISIVFVTAMLFAIHRKVYSQILFEKVSFFEARSIAKYSGKSYYFAEVGEDKISFEQALREQQILERRERLERERIEEEMEEKRLREGR